MLYLTAVPGTLIQISLINGEGKQPTDKMFLGITTADSFPSDLRCLPAGDPEHYNFFNGFRPGALVTQGNFNVHDATP